MPTHDWTAHVPSLIGGGMVGHHIRTTDWAGTSMGDYRTWPQSLRSALSLVLNTKGVAALFWGPRHRLFYNDAYAAALGERHPLALGRPMMEVLTDIAPIVGPQIERVLQTGEGFAVENQTLVLHRHGHDEDTVWTYSFSPIQGEADAFAGVLLSATEVTRQRTAEQAQRQGRTWLETALKVAKLGTYEWNTVTGVVEMDAGRADLGLQPRGSGAAAS